METKSKQDDSEHLTKVDLQVFKDLEYRREYSFHKTLATICLAAFIGIAGIWLTWEYSDVYVRRIKAL